MGLVVRHHSKPITSYIGEENVENGVFDDGRRRVLPVTVTFILNYDFYRSREAFSFNLLDAVGLLFTFPP